MSEEQVATGYTGREIGPIEGLHDSGSDLSDEARDMLERAARAILNGPGEYIATGKQLHDLAAAVLDAALPGWRNGISRDHGLLMSGGGYQLRNPGEHIEKVFPLQQWIELAQRDGGHVYQRDVIVVSDWREVPE